MKDKLLTQLLGAALLHFCVQHGAAPQRHRPHHKDTHSSGGVFLAKHDSSSVSKVASGERRPQQRRRQNELIQSAASVGVKQSPVRSGAAVLLVGARAVVNKGCVLCMSSGHNRAELLLSCCWSLSPAWQLQQVLCLRAVEVICFHNFCLKP